MAKKKSISIYLSIYLSIHCVCAHLPRTCHRLLHTRSRVSQGQEKLLAMSADKQTCNYDRVLKPTSLPIVIRHFNWVVGNIMVSNIHVQIFQEMSWSGHPILKVEIARTTKRCQHPLLTSKPATTTECSNHHFSQSSKHTEIEP